MIRSKKAFFLILILSLSACVYAAESMKLGTNFWFLASWSGEKPFVSGLDWNTAYAKGTRIWNPLFLAELGPFSTLRFMDWGATNNSTIREWKERRLPGDSENPEIGYVGPGDPVRAGLAYEWMIDLANITGKDAWICVPHEASDDYVRNLATLIKSKLDPKLRVYIEYSNETWNGSFTQFQYTLDKGTALGLSGENKWYQGGAFSVFRSFQIFDQFAKVFGSEMSKRVIRVVSYSGNADIFDAAYGNLIKNAKWNPAGQRADYLAVAPYIGHELDGASDSIARDWEVVLSKTVEEYVEYAASLAKKYGLVLCAYEGGQHLLKNADAWSKNPKIYDAYIHMLDRMAPYFALFNHYALAGVWRPDGAWGSLDHTGQPIAEAHKYRALVDWSSKH